MTWERARKPEQKAAREQAILQAARTLFSELAYDDISLNGIAREARISKANVYRYFSSREEIFLTIFEAELETWTQALIQRLKSIRSKDCATDIAQVWVETCQQHPTFLDLLPLLSLSLEQNSSVAQIVAFKQIAFARFADLHQIHADLYPQLTDEQWQTVLECVIALMAGLGPMTSPGPNVKQALQHPDVQQTPWHFDSLMAAGIVSMIQGHAQMKRGD